MTGTVLHTHGSAHELGTVWAPRAKHTHVRKVLPWQTLINGQKLDRKSSLS